MFRAFSAICLLLVLTICASGDEFNGLNSRAFDISASFSSNLEHGVAFTSMDPSGRANGITVQSRSLGGVISCTVTLPLPRDYRGRVAQQVSHPALSTSGWLFVSANVNASPEDSNEWRLYALQHTGAHQCSGWSNTWRQVGAAFDGPVNSAPDAVVALGVYTFVFVTDRRGAIVYSRNDSAHPEPAWSRFYPLSAGSNNPLFAAASKPAVAIYLDGVPRVHVFWLNRSYEYVNHVSGTVSLIGDVVTATPDQRRIEDGSGPTRARTGCTAGPEIRPTNPFFVVCGNSRAGSTTAYSIAHYRQPRSSWNSSAVDVGRSECLRRVQRAFTW